MSAPYRETLEPAAGETVYAYGPWKAIDICTECEATFQATSHECCPSCGAREASMPPYIGTARRKAYLAPQGPQEAVDGPPPWWAFWKSAARSLGVPRPFRWEYRPKSTYRVAVNERGRITKR